MRAALLSLAAILAFAAPAFAGDVTVAAGQVTWKSTKCAAPTVPPSLRDANRETAANDMNVMMTQYNEYQKQMQGYMNCMSDEANGDANLVSQAVVNSAQASIDETKKSVDAMGAALKAAQ
ncbi:MAG TPA: hypothetical protein VFR09_09375 [Alphaproteobacteria bacterium]|nr:hypothetical protein [Alphaproteobacteria bacterium]